MTSEWSEWFSELEQANREMDENSEPPPGRRFVGYAGGYWREEQAQRFRWLGPERWLSQFGLNGRFRDEPRYDFPIHETSLSMSEGRKAPGDMMMIVMRRPPRRRDRPAVRYFRTEDLWEQGFSVAQTPNDNDHEHVSVYCAFPKHVVDVVEAMRCWNLSGRARMSDIARETED